MEITSSAQKTGNRNYGIDLLRLVAMFYVVIFHVLGYGGVLGAAVSGSKVAINWFMRIWVMCAVNIYGMISGYVGYTNEAKPYRYSRYVTMWCQTVFYGLLGAGLFLAISPDVLFVKHLILACLPVTSNQWWYFTAYTGLFFLIPWINRLIRGLTEGEMTRLVAVCVLIFSLYSTAASLFREPFNLNEGFSTLWLVILYIIGAWMKKCRIPEKARGKKWVLIGTGCIIITWLQKLAAVFLLEDGKFRFLESYISPTVVCIAAAYLIVFSKLKLSEGWKKLISFFSPAAFGVYLFHMQWDILDGTITAKLAHIAQLPVWNMLFLIILVSAIIFAAGLLVDKVRAWLFKVLRIDIMANWIEEKLRGLADKMLFTNDRQINE